LEESSAETFVAMNNAKHFKVKKFVPRTDELGIVDSYLISALISEILFPLKVQKILKKVVDFF
jgi:hypothetical protein